MSELLQQRRHSLAHLLAAAVLELWPDAKRTIGPAIDDGFYYDFEFSQPISEDDLPKIEAKMREILPTWTSFDREEVTTDDAKKAYASNPYKLELIDEFSGKGQTLTFYRSGKFSDLCRGGHTEGMNTIDPQSFKLSKVAGAYWRGDEAKAQLTRIYGVAFETKAELDAYLTMLEEAKKRDHKVLGPALDLFTFSDLVGAGLPLWTPKGTLVRSLLDQFVWSLRSAKGYERVEIPHITKKDLYVTSGHWEKYQDDLFKIISREGHEFALKPMNCPHHTQIYARKQWSYRELPQRYANTTMCYRDEQSGELAGLSRVRGFTQDDAHVFCRMSQVKEEFLKIWDFVREFYGAFGFTLKVRLSMRDPEHPEKYLGEDANWVFAENMLREIATEKNADAYDGPGEAAFYGPKLDFMAKDAIGREWQVATIQLDMSMPERFNLSCINEQGDKERIVMIHAAIMGSLERFMAILIEHTAGVFPLWLTPVQAMILPVADRHIEFARQLSEKLQAAGMRIEIDETAETVGKKIRNAERLKAPVMLVVGDKEASGEPLTVRWRGEKDQRMMSFEELSGEMLKRIIERT